MASSVVSCCCCPSASTLGILLIERCAPACLGCKNWLFELLLSSYQLEVAWPFSSDLWHHQDVFAQRTAHNWRFIYLFFQIWENLSRSAVCEIRPSGINNRATCKVTFKSPSLFWCPVWTSAAMYVYMPKYIDLLPCDWLIKYLY